MSKPATKTVTSPNGVTYAIVRRRFSEVRVGDLVLIDRKPRRVTRNTKGRRGEGAISWRPTKQGEWSHRGYECAQVATLLVRVG